MIRCSFHFADCTIKYDGHNFPLTFLAILAHLAFKSFLAVLALKILKNFVYRVLILISVWVFQFMRKINLYILVCFAIVMTSSGWAGAWQGGLTVFGRVYLPDGQPAVRAKVKIEVINGFWREVWSDDQGNYEFRGVIAGRYRLSATNPEDSEQFSEPAESDSTCANC